MISLQLQVANIQFVAWKSNTISTEPIKTAQIQATGYRCIINMSYEFESSYFGKIVDFSSTCHLSTWLGINHFRFVIAEIWLLCIDYISTIRQTGVEFINFTAPILSEQNRLNLQYQKHAKALKLSFNQVLKWIFSGKFLTKNCSWKWFNQ